MQTHLHLSADDAYSLASVATQSQIHVALDPCCAPAATHTRVEIHDNDRFVSLGRDESLSIAVNLSVRQMLAPDIAGLIGGVLERTGVHPGDLCLEWTESVSTVSEPTRTTRPWLRPLWRWPVHSTSR